MQNFYSGVRSGKRENASKVRKGTELASQLKFVRREPGRDGKILRFHGQDGNVAVGGIGDLAR